MSEEIDISAIKKGDKVLVEGTVTNVTDNVLYLEGFGSANGTYCYFDKIKQHTPKAFDWAEVKPMDAFVDRGDVVYYVANDPTSINFVVVTSEKTAIDSEDLYVMRKVHLDRAPEYDVKAVGDE